MSDDIGISGIKYSKIDEIKPEENSDNLIFTDNAPTLSLIKICLNNKTKHIVQRSNIDPPKEISVAQNMENDPDKYFSFPLSTIFGNPNPTAETESALRQLFFEVSNSSDKYALMSTLERYVKGLTKASSLLYEVLNTADELYTNAIYNAPFVDYANDSNGAERDFNSVHVADNKRPYFFAGHDGSRIVLGCNDQFGTLNVQKLLSKIKKCYENDLSAVINYSSGGAGIGAFMIFESSASVYIAVRQGIQTLICCSFAYKLNSVSRTQLPKNLHIYSG